MTTKQLYKTIAITAFAAAVMLAGMFTISLITGASPQHFELVAPPEIYAQEIAAVEGPLRLALTLDNLFLTFYTTAFVFLAITLWEGNKKMVVAVGLGAVLITTYLDLHENHDILTQLTTVLNGLPIALDDLQQRMIFSQLKFHSSYLGFFLLAFVLPGDTFLEKFLKLSLWFGYLPIGILVYSFPNPVFDLLRITFMLAGLTLLGWNYLARYRKTEAA